VFNVQGSELLILMLLALVVLGPEKLPEAMRKLGSFYAQMKKMSSSFQQEFHSAVGEPMREMRAVVEQPMQELRQTANMIRDSADFRTLQSGERDEKPKSAEMAAVPVGDLAPADPELAPSVDLPFTEIDPSEVIDIAAEQRSGDDITPTPLPPAPAPSPDVSQWFTPEPQCPPDTAEPRPGDGDEPA
jgi:sec-independent protein translocase protein TatB